MDELESALHQYFGFERFRSGQREVIERVIARRATLAVLPTGLGKSLCYQLAAQILPGTTLVFSPLIALMQDQVQALQRRGFTNATYLNSALDPQEVGARFRGIEGGRYKLIYVAPERCDSARFQRFVRQAEISLVVIDEAHCISQWGHDFRPHYRHLMDRLPELRRATILALTATATPEVQTDIAATLALPQIEREIGDFNRPNLRFEVLQVDKQAEKDARLIELLAKGEGAAIVYASTRPRAERAYQLLRNRGYSVCLYRGGLDQRERSQAQESFQQGRCRIVVATNAFGMGIDKPDVRQVIHYNIPGSLESYYQEAGRAGRDEAPATCTLLYSQQDIRVQRYLIEQAYPDPKSIFRLYDLLHRAHPLSVSVRDLATAGELSDLQVSAALQLLYEQQWLQMSEGGKYAVARPDCERPNVNFRTFVQRRRRAGERLDKMIAYAAGRVCRRAQILNYFGQKFTPPCSGCDVCVSTTSVAKQSPRERAANETSDRVARVILETSAEFSGRLGRTLVTELLCGSRSKRLLQFGLERSPHYGALKLHRRELVIGWIDDLIDQKLLATTAAEYPRLFITDAGRRAAASPSLLPLPGTPVSSAQPTRAEDRNTRALAARATASAPPGAAANPELVARLKRWRLERANSLDTPAFTILHNSVLDDIALRQPGTLAELAEIKGIGPGKAEHFGKEILAVVGGVSVTGPRPVSQKKGSEGPDAETSTDLFLQMEIWRQGGDAPEEEVLLEALENRSNLERGGLIVVVNALADLGVKQSARALLELMAETSDGNLLSAICKALAELGVQHATPELIRLLSDVRPGVRRTAVRALGRLRAPAALAELERLSNEDEQQSVRLAARAAALLVNKGI